MTDGRRPCPDAPTGTTIDGTPWQEARPPHLPDTVTGLPVPTILVRARRSWSGSCDPRPAPRRGRRARRLVVYVLSRSSRRSRGPHAGGHPRCATPMRWSAHRTMLFGTILLRRGPGSSLLATSARTAASRPITPPPEDLPWLNPLGIAIYRALISPSRSSGSSTSRSACPGPAVRGPRRLRRWCGARGRGGVRRVHARARRCSVAVTGHRGRDVRRAPSILTVLSVVLSIGVRVSPGRIFTGDAIARLAGRRGAERGLGPGGLRRARASSRRSVVLGDPVGVGLPDRGPTSRRMSSSCHRSSRPSPTWRCSPRSRSAAATHAPVDEAADEAGRRSTIRPRRSRPADDLAGSTA